MHQLDGTTEFLSPEMIQMVVSGPSPHTSYQNTNSCVRFEFEKAKLRIQIVDAKVVTFKSEREGGIFFSPPAPPSRAARRRRPITHATIKRNEDNIDNIDNIMNHDQHEHVP